MTGLAHPVPEYLRRHVHYTFAGFNDPPLFALLRERVGVERMMFSADHPFKSMATARRFLDALPVPDAERARIAHGNAEALFGL